MMTNSTDTSALTHSDVTRPRGVGRQTDVRHDSGCACPVCAGLQTFVRPRFFAGQLLTESELMLLEQYVLDKHRLHNVHLHGWGVVCGLQVRCDDCGDGVIVEPGYAIDPCGNDIIVPEAQRIDVIRMLNACIQQATAPCDPPQYEQPQTCDDESTWCLYARYREWNTRAVTPLAGSKPTCGCGSTSSCSCGSAGKRPGWECTCGAGSANASTCGCGGGPVTPNRQPECEPTRTKELYEFGVCRSDGSCRDLGDRLAGTFPVKAFECLSKIRPIFERHVTTTHAKTAAAVLLDPGASASTDVDPGAAICALYDAVVETYRTDPMRTMCVLPAELGEIDCSPRGPNEEQSAYADRMGAAAAAILMLIVAYVRDCICYQLMPPCPEPACDDRVILACMTVRDGRVVDICNFDCRRHAGSFVARNYWLPIGPIIGWVIGMLCCTPLLGRKRGRLSSSDRVRMFVAQARVSNVRNAVLRDDFAVVRGWQERARSFGRSIRFDSLLRRTDRIAEPLADNVNLAAFMGMEVATAHSGLADAQVVIESTQVLAADEPLPVRMALFPSATAGDRLIAYERAGRIVGFGPLQPTGAAPPPTNTSTRKPANRKSGRTPKGG